MEEDRLVAKVFGARIMEKRKRGRPERTWIGDVGDGSRSKRNNVEEVPVHRGRKK